MQGLHEAGAIDTLTMRRFDALNLPPVKHYTPAQIRGIRKRTKASLNVFAAVLNVSKSTAASWERDREQGGKEPSGPALKLLDLVDRKGLEALA
jgi:putative transcriptional regulator